MRVLLDSQAFLWYVWDAGRLTPTAVAHIEDGANRCFVSMASLWEIAIKVSTGKLALKRPFREMESVLVYGNGFDVLPITFDHTILVAALPFHHRDPFDRLLVAQSLSEAMPIVSSDAALDAYGIRRIW